MTTQTIPKGWTRTTLGDVAEINPTESLAKGKPAKSVPMDRLAPFTRQISEFEIKEFNGGMKFRNGDTLLARITPCLENGKTSFVDILDDGEIGFGSTEFIVIREKQKLSDKYFLYYFAISPRFRENAIKAMTGTSGRQRVQIDLLVDSQFLFPPLPEQRAIAAVLSSLDDKIELLRKNNKTLGSIAQALFKRWFVEYEFPAEIIKNSPPAKEGWQTKSDGVVNNKNPLKTFRKKLRNNLTPAEAKLWTYLQNSKLDGRKFRRQHSVDNYILDFYCPSEKLAVELDGEVHNNPIQAEYDYERDLFLRYYGIKVLRFENKLVFENPDYLLNRIREAFGKQSLPPTTPPFGHPSLPGGEFLGYKSSGGKMIDSELGKIPEGWRVGRLEDEFKIIMGQSPDGDSYNEGGKGMIFFQGRTDFQERFPRTRLYTTEPKRIAEKNDVLVSVRAPVGDINVAFEKCCIGRGLGAVRGKYKSYALYKIQSLKDAFKNFEAEGTVFGSINKDSFAGIEVIIPPVHCIEKYEGIANPIDQKIFNNTSQIQTLSRLRDSLLPKLMKGEVRAKGFCKGE